MNVGKLNQEWERLESLTDIALMVRQSQAPGQDRLDALNLIHSNVQAARERGVWDDILPRPSTPYDYDILSSVIAADISPRIAHIYQMLHGQKNTPYPTLHVLQELLRLKPVEMSGLYKAVNENSPLQKLGLVTLSRNDPHGVIRPGHRTREMIMGVSSETAAPSGTNLIENTLNWTDLILPNSVIDQLKNFAALVTCKAQIVEQWGSQTYTGPIGLFCGPSGTGKTMAASVIANELGFRLYRVDIGRLVSKYIGETERNLSELFAAAHNQNIVLQFDEADALFAKRGAVRHASDRYANQQGSHLLTAIEAHNGPCILTTNLRQQIDPAFMRRFHSVVDFPMASITARRALWSRHLPNNAPLSKDIDLDVLAKYAPLNGGSIRNAALQACVMAARKSAASSVEPSALGMPELSHAIWLELQKKGRAVSPSEIGPLAKFLESETR